MTSHISTLCATYGVSVMKILEKIGHDVAGHHCMEIIKFKDVIHYNVAT